MSKNLQLTLAVGDYEITRPLIDGRVKADGIDLTVVSKMDSTTRHWRFLRNQDFDVAEISCSSYMAARDKGHPFVAIPVFPHRRFRHGFIFINTKKGITKPTDLIGKKVGVKQYQASAILWMRGILESEYGVPHRSIDWYSELDESVPFVPPPGLKLTKLPDDRGVEEMLAKGELDALLHPDLIQPMLDKDPNVGRLFPDYKSEEKAFYQRTGIFPIMHVVGIKKEIVDANPWVAINLFHAFNEAKAMGLKRMENPRVAPLAWYREAWEEQQEVMGPDPFEYGMTEKNEKELNLLAKYSFEQGISSKQHSLDDLFLKVDQGRKRGHIFRV